MDNDRVFPSRIWNNKLMNDLNESQLIPVLLFLSKGQKNNVHTQVA